MCGIFLYFSKSGAIDPMITKLFNKLSHRGPDKKTLNLVKNCFIGFHRLAINDVSDIAMQPFELDGNFVMCNGEIYNSELIQQEEKFILKSHSDCEILPHLFKKYGIEQSVEMIDGVFAILSLEEDSIKIVRDRIGVKPLFYSEGENFFAVASEAKALEGLNGWGTIQLEPYVLLEYNLKTFQKTFKNLEKYPVIPFPPTSLEECVQKTREILENAVEKRLTSDREIGCLLSGGLDSSIIASILAKKLALKGQKLHTFSVGFEDSTDLKYAKIVSKHIGSIHHELLLFYNQALNKIQTVVEAIESYDTTTVRASVPMYMLCEMISQNFPHKVIFSGEGSDEIFCGYLYFHNSPNSDEAHKDSLRLVEELYKYDVLRADRCTAGNGLEFREPFLDKDLINFVRGIPGEFKIPQSSSEEIFEKTIIRIAFSDYLPQEVVWRRKAAFSDAVSGSEKPWYKWIQEHISKKFIPQLGGTDESNYYKSLFYNYFKDYKPEIPLWLPRWSDVGQEPSATVIKNVYKAEEH
jgi:asparagine synthase (glutamine-hydrolysing)